MHRMGRACRCRVLHLSALVVVSTSVFALHPGASAALHARAIQGKRWSSPSQGMSIAAVRARRSHPLNAAFRVASSVLAIRNLPGTWESPASRQNFSTLTRRAQAEKSSCCDRCAAMGPSRAPRHPSPPPVICVTSPETPSTDTTATRPPCG